MTRQKDQSPTSDVWQYEIIPPYWSVYFVLPWKFSKKLVSRVRLVKEWGGQVLRVDISRLLGEGATDWCIPARINGLMFVLFRHRRPRLVPGIRGHPIFRQPRMPQCNDNSDSFREWITFTFIHLVSSWPWTRGWHTIAASFFVQLLVVVLFLLSN